MSRWDSRPLGELSGSWLARILTGGSYHKTVVSYYVVGPLPDR
jgi:hypothetical protein